MSVFEALMLLCFGLSWPISIAKTLRTKRVEGKSPLFMAVILLGYLSGILHKLIYSRDWIIFLYLFNCTVISVDLYLYFRYCPRPEKPPFPREEV